MDWLWSADYSSARFLLERGIAAIYLIGFANAALQFPALLGEHGLEPAPRFLRAVPFRRTPSIFHFHYSDRALRAVALTGAGVALAILLGAGNLVPLPVLMLMWALLWVLYLSILNVGQDFYSFGWESLLVESGFLAIFLGNAEVPPSFLVIVLFRWLAFRLEFGAGLIKLRGDQCWRDLTCMDYHHETQPMPNPLSWFFHHLPRRLHRIEVLGNYFAQLIAPWGLFLPQPIATLSALVMIATQLYLVISGNYAWLNWLTIVISCSGLADSVLRGLLPIPAASYPPAPLWFAGAVIAVTAVVLVLSYWPARNLVSRRQLMNAPFNALHLVNAYGAFGTVTRRRLEVVVEGTADDELTPGATWQEYEFKGKPTDPRRLPPQVAPYHLRLDWLMWFAALSPAYAEGWFLPFLLRLLENDRPTLGLLGRNPFPDSAPTFVRARLFLYHYTSWRQLRQSGAWWTRDLVGEFVSPVRLRATADGMPSLTR